MKPQRPTAPSAQTSEAWYVMRVTYQREVIAQKRFSEMGLESFVPMKRSRRRTPQGRTFYIDEPAIHNFIFVRACKQQLDSLKRCVMPWLRYMVVRDAEGNSIMTVPDEQMRSFIAVAGNKQEQASYMLTDGLDLSQGDRVRVIAGPFVGVEGVFIRLKGQRKKRVVVSIEGVVAIATTTIPISMVEKI